MLQGRTFTWNDSEKAPRVAVVNQEFARKVFGSETKAIGGFFKMWGGTRVQVVGVVEDGKYKTLSEDPQPALFLPILQSPRTDTWLIVRSRQSAGPDASLGTYLYGLDPGLPFTMSTWTRNWTRHYSPRVRPRWLSEYWVDWARCWR